MRLYLVRHAEALSKSANPDRPLSAAGVRETELLRQLLLRFNLGIEAIWHSPKARSAQTAGILAPGVRCRKGLVVRKDVRPASKPRHVIPELQRVRGDIMIVGHLPHLGRLAADLLGWKHADESMDWGKPCIVALERKADWKLLWSLGPQEVRTILKKQKQDQDPARR